MGLNFLQNNLFHFLLFDKLFSVLMLHMLGLFFNDFIILSFIVPSKFCICK